MGEENKVVLHGMWGCPYVKGVELALRFKGIPYEYVEEDLTNKSPLLLKYNPVYKKVPVLVHNGKPIAQSLIVIEYIDESWKNSPKLLPQDPCKRAKVRFWAEYIQGQLFEAVYLVLKTEGETQEKAIKEVAEKLEVLEEGIKDIYQDGIPIFNTDNVGFLEVVTSSLFGRYKALEEVVGLVVVDPEKTPFVFSWLEAINETPLVKESLPHDKLVAFARFYRQNAIKSAAN